MTNNLILICESINCNGYPCADIKLDDSTVYRGVIDDHQNKFNISVPSTAGMHTLSIQRYGKTEKNISPDCEQILKVNSILIDGVAIPKHILVNNSAFEFNNTTNHGSLDFYPNGTWTFYFQTPAITWCVNQKIVNDAKFSNDYVLPWSYKLGPGQADQLIDDIDQLFDKLKTIHD
jgi:hypothetical protein